MTHNRKPLAIWGLIALLTPAISFASTPFAGEDFDAGATNGGYTAATGVFSPDNSGGSERGMWPSGSFFDRFGIVSRSDNLPYDFQDDSAGSFTIDAMGILRTGKLDNVVIVADTRNSQNSDPDGTVTAEWTFDISGRSNLELSIDMAMTGDFELEGDDIPDRFDFTYSIDGGASDNAFTVRADAGYYGVAMESGDFYARYYTPTNFWDEAAWLELTLAGPYNDITWHPDDNGQDGDTTANDGYIPIEGIDGVIEERALTSGNFTDIERLAYKDPLYVNGDSATGTLLTNNYETQTVPLSGTGSTLTLTFTAQANSDQEFFSFDNILLSEGEATANLGDFNGDLAVDAADYTIWRDNLGQDSSVLMGNGSGESTVGQADYVVWQENYGAAYGALTAGTSQVPEPASALIAMVAFAFRSRMRSRG